jgi:tetratricopeptide (TPR) repeat protein
MLHGHALSLSLALALSGQVAEALALFEQSIRQTSIPTLLRLPVQGVTRLGEVYLLAGRLEEASHYAERLLEFALAHQERGRQAWALRLLGEIAARCDPQCCEEAKSYYQQALALANELGMRPLQAHCHRGLGTLYSQTGQMEQARTELTTAIEMYRDMEMAFWLPETEAALADVEGR